MLKPSAFSAQSAPRSLRCEHVKHTLRRAGALLAQFVKRVGWSEFRSNAVDDDEAYLMRDAFDALRIELGIHGYSPR
jgi:hypothetical protein